MIDKIQVHQACIDMLLGKINSIQNNMQLVQESANNEEKSSAGDKYETGRAMSHLSQEMNAKQLQQVQHELAILKAIQTIPINDTIKKGALIKTNIGYLYLTVALGNITLSGQKLIALSPSSPLGNLLLQKRAGDTILFNKQTIVVIDFC
jgi:hypothetical protein